MQNVYKFIFLAMLISNQLKAQVVVADNNAQSITGNATSPAALSISNFLVPANNNRLLVVCSVNTSNSPPPAITFNSQAMTQGISKVTPSSGSVITVFYLPLGSSASATTANIQAVGTNVTNLVANSFYNVEQITPIDGTISTSFTSTSATGYTQTFNIASGSDDMVCDCIGAFSAAAGITALASNQTLIGQNVATSPNGLRLGMSTKAGTSATEMSWDFSGNFSINQTLRGSQVGLNMRSISTLPIQLMTFEAQDKADGKIYLKWITGSERNNHSFDIEHSQDGISFSKMGAIAAKGKAATYAFVDETPFSNTNYYRLKSINNDESFDYSKIISVQKRKRSNNIKIFPTVTRDGITIENNGLPVDEVTIFNQVGQMLMTTQMTNNININHLPAGMYFVHIQTGNERLVKKIFKQ